MFCLIVILEAIKQTCSFPNHYLVITSCMLNRYFMDGSRKTVG